MTPRDLIAGAPVAGLMGSPEVDPLTEEDALQEARLNELVFDAVNRRLGLLLDLRGAVQLRMAYTGLILLEEVESFNWVSEQRAATRTAWNIVGSVPVNENGTVSLRLLFFPDAEMTVNARIAAFFAGNVPGLPGRPPDFADSEEMLSAGMASMNSPFEPTQATFIRPISCHR